MLLLLKQYPLNGTGCRVTMPTFPVPRAACRAAPLRQFSTLSHAMVNIGLLLSVLAAVSIILFSRTACSAEKPPNVVFFDLYDPAKIKLPPYKADDLDDLPPAIRKAKTARAAHHKRLVELDAVQDAIHGYLASISYADGGEELYQVRKDPNEWHNLAAMPEHAAVKERMRKAAPEHFAPPLPEHNRLRLVVDGESFRWEPRKKPAAKGAAGPRLPAITRNPHAS
jgi:hypothetical protein